jgi:hypothetical protein
VISTNRNGRSIGVQLSVALACIFFFSAGFAIAPLLGIEADETLFVQAIFPPRADLYSVRIGHISVPLMLMNYVGALKSWLYPPLFRAFGAGLLTLRLPMVVAGTASIWLFFLLLRRVAGVAAALVGCTLLAVDSAYLLTLCFDWGPVALQHLLFIGGILAILKFYQEKNDRWLGLGFLLFGLVLWDKAVAIWMLSGLAAATLAVFPRQALSCCQPRRLAVALVAFGLGASPLLAYNVRHHWTTFAGNFHPDTKELGVKVHILRETAQGSGLFGWLTAEDWQTPHPHPPVGKLQRLSADISALAGHPRRHLLLVGFLLSLLLAPLAGAAAIRAILFALITMGAAWAQMAITANAGGSLHHTILLWPFPEWVIAISWVGVSRRAGRVGLLALASVLAVLLVAGVLVMNEYYAVAVRNGGAQYWTNAIFPLSEYLKRTPAKTIYCMDWGILDPLRFLHHGRLPLAEGADQVGQPEIGASDRKIIESVIADPANLFISHTRDFQFFPEWNSRLLQVAASSGYQQVLQAEVRDSFGRPVFTVYRFRPGTRNVAAQGNAP